MCMEVVQHCCVSSGCSQKFVNTVVVSVLCCFSFVNMFLLEIAIACLLLNLDLNRIDYSLTR
jgi:hypothetical protein